MKHNKIIPFAAAAILFCGCADNEMYTQAQQEPGVTGQYDYLNNYGCLKTYVDRSANPDFKLGTGVAASDYLAYNRVWALTNNNFDEFTPGNAMKFASIVKDDGKMNFSTVKDLVNRAAESGLTVYGHTLCWHSQQNNTYLKSMFGPANYYLHINVPEAKAKPWDANACYSLSNPLEVGKTYVIKLKGRANVQVWNGDGAFSVSFWPTCNAGTQYLPGFSLTDEWADHSVEFTATVPLEKLDFKLGMIKGDIDFDDVTLTEKGTDTNLILNPDFNDSNIGVWSNGSCSFSRNKEEAQTISDPKALTDSLNVILDRWVGGMMTACDGKVKAFDAVNEPMSDAVPAELKTGGRDGDTKTNFFWQDYLGKNYARTVVALARQYGPSDLKLFINDYNLEAAYNNNAKCKGLIDMIKYWESDNTTKIDGIGTQMHVTYSMDKTKQTANEAAVVNQFKLLAASGKLIKISELDMGISDASGNTIMTADVTKEQKEAMSDYYKFIVKAYFENIPAAQRYGITQWAQTDSPASSGWRAGEPIGLWDLNYSRKPAYGGFADGLAGK